MPHALLKVIKAATALLAGLFVLLLIGMVLASRNIYRWTDVSEMSPPYQTSEATREFHRSLLVADLHADTATNLVDFSEPQAHGHIGRERLEAGNYSLLTLALATEATMRFTASGERIRGLNPIAFAAMANGWPRPTWSSNYARGQFFLEHAKAIVAEHSDRMYLIQTQEDLIRLREAYDSRPPRPLGIVMAVEGIHILDGDLAKLPELIDDGVRMISLTHGFDNEAAGSNTGVSGAGLSEFGREVLRVMQMRGVILDLAHASETVIHEALELTSQPAVFSHTGVKATCDKNRNISDAAIRALGKNGGVIGVAFFTSALCGRDVGAIVAVMQHIKALIGAEHIALGSDYDGMVRVVFDAGGLPVLTEALLQNGFSADEVRLIMGENYLRVLGEVLPRAGDAELKPPA